MTSRKQRNLVDPLGNIETTADFDRSLMGNRGILGNDRLLGPPQKYHNGPAWIYCRYKGVRQPTKARFYTVLFFLDEATALAAGHRPCNDCSGDLYHAFTKLWPYPDKKAAAINQKLHQERFNRWGKGRTGKKKVYPDQPLDQLPTGAFIMRGNDSTPFVVLEDALYPWSITGYGAPISRPTIESVTLITPPTTVTVLKAGYRPQIRLTGGEEYFDETRWNDLKSKSSGRPSL